MTSTPNLDRARSRMARTATLDRARSRMARTAARMHVPRTASLDLAEVDRRLDALALLGQSSPEYRELLNERFRLLGL